MTGTMIKYNRLPEFSAINVGTCRNNFKLTQLTIQNNKTPIDMIGVYFYFIDVNIKYHRLFA